MSPGGKWENEKEDVYSFGFISHYPTLLLKIVLSPQVKSVLFMTIIPEQCPCPRLEPQDLSSYFALSSQGSKPRSTQHRAPSKNQVSHSS